MGHSHSLDHGRSDVRISPLVQRRLLIAVVPFVVATFAGLLILWPGQDQGTKPLPGAEIEQYRAVITDVEDGGCAAPPQGTNFECAVVTAELSEGPDAGESFEFDFARGPKTRVIQVDDKVFVSKSPEGQAGPAFYFSDYDRQLPMTALLILFMVVVVTLSRWHGVFSLVGVAISLGVLILFVMPAILEGTNPLAVAIVGASLIMFVNLYLAHGFNARTTTAILGTMASLSLTAGLALVFVEIGRFTGFGSEEALFLQLSADQINLQGLLLGGIIIGTLGVLDDVTITQASAVWELHVANPTYAFGDLYRSAIRIGRDHIASTVNTLVLAYAGASLPLLILFTVSQRRLDQVLNSEVVAEEIVRTLVGSIGLVASVPLTTALAAAVVAASRERKAPRQPKPERDKRSRHELEWREGVGAGDDAGFWPSVSEEGDPSGTRD